MFEATMRLILASGSPRRVDLIGSLGVEFDVHPAKGEEPCPESGEEPSVYAVRAARTKAEDVARLFPEAVVIGADTVVTINGEILGKPGNKEHAVEMLTKLAGRKHSVITGCSLVGPGWKKSEFYISTQVEFIDATPEMLRAYVATGETDDKAGAYAIQGLGAFLVRNVCGSYSNVVGLPLARVVEILSGWGVIVPEKV
ncbi:MAG: Maf family protein [Desulfovibrio sp.]|uniref:Maf family protein n=1 Tax=Desulfovibrio sp. 7SRBS1 TaxID=3378064 RepID=UPI003B40AF4B